MFTKQDVLYEDNHLLVVNKHCGDLVQPDKEGDSALEDEIKAWIKKRDNKPGAVFLGVVHRIDRPVSGAVLFAKTSKALTRLNEMIKNRQIGKTYWAVVENMPPEEEGDLIHHITRDSRTNKAKAHIKPQKDSKEARLHYKMIASSKNYRLLGIDLQTGRHHQIRCQLAKIGTPIRGDLKYGAPHSNKGGGISLHSRSLEFIHPVTKEQLKVTAPAPQDDNLWAFFEEAVR